MDRVELRFRNSIRGIFLAAVAAPASLAGACHAADTSVAPEADADAPDPCAPRAYDGSALDDAEAGCQEYRQLGCGLPDATQLRGCYLDLPTCAQICNLESLYYCNLSSVSCDANGGVFSDAATIVECVKCPGAGGRRPLGLIAPDAIEASPLGRWFAENAHLESASVRAFRDLQRWLKAYRAPRSLVREAERACSEERSHTRAMARLARRFGSTPKRPRVRRVPLPSLAELVTDSLVEGVVGETFGALLATWQAAHSSDPRVARTMRRIAFDETRHAALAWKIVRWAAPKLTSDERSHAQNALRTALSSLMRVQNVDTDDTVIRVAGYPTYDVTRRFVHELSRVFHGDFEMTRMLCA